MPITAPPIGIEKLSKDLKASAALLTDAQARYLVDTYYQLQDFRIRSAAQTRSSKEEPVEFNAWLYKQLETLENEIQKSLLVYAKNHKAGRWALSICGIGPVISAGLLAHCHGYNTVSQLWSFAGLNPTKKWNKKEKRPWNANLKVLVVFKAGESFIKVQNNPKDIYGKLYRQKKDLEIEKNERGGFAKEAEEKLASVKIGKDTEAYKAYSQGKLPPAHIHARARRYAAKMFLAHFAEVKYLADHGKPLPRPWVFDIAGHDDSHYTPPPNMEIE